MCCKSSNDYVSFIFLNSLTLIVSSPALKALFPDYYDCLHSSPIPITISIQYLDGCQIRMGFHSSHFCHAGLACSSSENCTLLLTYTCKYVRAVTYRTLIFMLYICVRIITLSMVSIP